MIHICINSYTNNNSSSLILKFKERVRNLQTRIIEKPEKLTSDRVFYNYFSIQQQIHVDLTCVRFFGPFGANEARRYSSCRWCFEGD